MAKNLIQSFSLEALHQFCEDTSLSVHGFLMLYYDPSDFLPAQSAEQLIQLAKLRSTENIGKHLMVQGNLYNRPVGKDGKQRTQVNAGGLLKYPLAEALNPSTTPLFTTSSTE